MHAVLSIGQEALLAQVVDLNGAELELSGLDRGGEERHMPCVEPPLSGVAPFGNHVRGEFRRHVYQRKRWLTGPGL
jgi:hypothetical protein